MYDVPTKEKTLTAYDSDIDEQQRREIREARDELADVRVAHVNSTATGGGVAEIVGSLVPLPNDVGVDTDWLVMDATAEFFDVTKDAQRASG